MANEITICPRSLWMRIAGERYGFSRITSRTAEETYQNYAPPPESHTGICDHGTVQHLTASDKPRNTK